MTDSTPAFANNQLRRKLKRANARVEELEDLLRVYSEALSQALDHDREVGVAILTVAAERLGVELPAAVCSLDPEVIEVPPRPTPEEYGSLPILDLRELLEDAAAGDQDAHEDDHAQNE